MMTPLLWVLAGCEPFDLLELQRAPDAVPVEVEVPRRDVFVDCDQDGDGAVRDDDACFGLLATVDCDDTDSSVFPGAPERCDGQDTDCDGVVDGPHPEDGTTWYLDADADGWGDETTAFQACDMPLLGAASTPGDCDDSDGTVHPAALEICADGQDQDCDGLDAELLDAGLTCAWVTVEGAPGTWAGGGVAGTGDLTCDGLPDLAISASDQGDTGQTRLYAGPFDQPGSARLVATLHDPERLGLSGDLAALGDLDGDGCDDVALAGDPAVDPDVAAWLLSGGSDPDDRYLADGQLSAPDIGPTTLVTRVGDGTAPLLVLAPERALAWLVGDPAGSHTLPADTALTASAELDTLGQVAALGDLDGDGLAEVVLGAPEARDGAGLVLVVSESDTQQALSEDHLVLEGRSGAGLGAALVIAGDLDQDGLADLVVGAPDEAVAGDDRAGAVRILRGGALADGPDGTLYGIGGERLGHALAAPGNLTPDLDDRPDLVVASGADGTLYWFPRTDAGGIARPEQLGPRGLGGAGVTLDAPGDLDLDGVPDLVVGVPTEDRVHLLVAAQFGL